MKTSYLPRNNFRNPKKKRVIIAIIIFAILAFLLSNINIPLLSLLSPAWSSQNAATAWLGQNTSLLKSKRALVEENNELRRALLSAEVKISALGNAEEREAELLELAGRAQDNNAVVAAVLVHPPRTPYDTLVIDAGTQQGISAGSKVFLPEGPEIGRVESVEGHSSLVRLYSSSGERTDAVLERHSLPAVLMGGGGGDFKIIFPRETQVEVGDRILSADINSRLLAVVGDVSMKPTDSFKEVLAKSPANIFNLRYVLVKP